MFSIGALAGLVGFVHVVWTCVSLVEGTDKGLVNYSIVSQRSAQHFLQVKSRQKRNTEMKTDIEKLHINSDIQARFAQTIANCNISNQHAEDLETNFNIFIPKEAFISNFTMMIDGEFYVAKVKSKADAEKEYQEARKLNRTAAQVSLSHPPPDTPPNKELFIVQVNIKAFGYATFSLTYLDLLVRRLGVYKHSISIRPNQPVQDLRTIITVYEPQEFQFFEVFEPGSNEVSSSDDVVFLHDSGTYKELMYDIDLEKQQSVDPTNSINGDLIITYDIKHEKDAGLVVVDGQYFSHLFSPGGLEIISKNVIFVIDRSGSMKGLKIEQTRQAMLTIIDQLKHGDHFQILLFNSGVEMWQDEGILPATRENIEQAKVYISTNLIAEGGTNINDGLVTAGKMLQGANKNAANIIVFLTDGRPTSGVTNENDIVHHVTEAVTGGLISVYCIGFGFALNINLLFKIAYRTGGNVKQIDPESDARIELQNYMQEISQPKLLNVDISYTADVTDQVTSTQFGQYFNGTEIVVCGILKADIPPVWDVVVTGLSKTQITMTKTVDTNNSPLEKNKRKQGFTQRLWAYKMIKEYFIKLSQTDDEEKITLLTENATLLAIEYNLVTKFTSMVITQRDPSKPSDHGRSRSSGKMADLAPGSFPLHTGASDSLSCASLSLQLFIHISVGLCVFWFQLA